MSQLNQIAPALVGGVAEHMLRVTVLTIILTFAMRWFWPGRTRVHLLGWTLLAIAASLLPMIGLVAPHWNLLDGTAVSTLPSGGGPAVSTQVVGLAMALQERATVSWLEWSRTTGPIVVAWLYVIGVGIGLLRLGRGWLSARAIVFRASSVEDASLVARLGTVMARVGLARRPHLVETSEIDVPFVTGLLRPALVLPRQWRLWDDGRLESVLLHECAHLARRDLWAIHLVAVYRAAMWINPAAWWMCRRLHALVESASDEAVLEAGADRAAYAETLVTFMATAQRVHARTAWQLSMARRHDRNAEQRIDHVLDWRGDDMGFTTRMRLGVLALVLVAAVVVAAVGMSAQPGHLPVPQLITVQATGPKPSTEGIVAEPAAESSEPPVTAPATPTQAQVPERSSAPAVQEAPAGGYSFTTPGLVVPVSLTRENPKYTPEAMRARIEGRVSLMALIGADGKVTDVRVQESLDDVYGLDESAMASARRWTFKPGSLNGRNVAVWVVIEMEFKLH